mgnify:CR=1 FL=1
MFKRLMPCFLSPGPVIPMILKMVLIIRKDRTGFLSRKLMNFS